MTAAADESAPAARRSHRWRPRRVVKLPPRTSNAACVDLAFDPLRASGQNRESRSRTFRATTIRAFRFSPADLVGRRQDHVRTC